MVSENTEEFYSALFSKTRTLFLAPQNMSQREIEKQLEKFKAQAKKAKPGGIKNYFAASNMIRFSFFQEDISARAKTLTTAMGFLDGFELAKKEAERQFISISLSLPDTKEQRALYLRAIQDLNANTEFTNQLKAEVAKINERIKATEAKQAPPKQEKQEENKTSLAATVVADGLKTLFLIGGAAHLIKKAGREVLFSASPKRRIEEELERTSAEIRRRVVMGIIKAL